MLDHVTFSVADLEAAKRFYVAALAPIGYVLRHEFEHGDTSIVGIGSEKSVEVWFYR
jgi:catechol 2,3-dioxygenase-like lactoylglutathione lyase family enzyme